MQASRRVALPPRDYPGPCRVRPRAGRRCRALRAGPGGARRLHAHPGRRIRGSLRRPAAQHPPLAAAQRTAACTPIAARSRPATAYTAPACTSSRANSTAARWSYRHGSPSGTTTTRPALAARVLAEEHRIYPECIGWFAAGRLQLRDGAVHARRPAAAAPRWCARRRMSRMRDSAGRVRPGPARAACAAGRRRARPGGPAAQARRTRRRPCSPTRPATR